MLDSGDDLIPFNSGKKVGYIKGTSWAIPPLFTMAGDFSEGLATVEQRKNGDLLSLMESF